MGFLGGFFGVGFFGWVFNCQPCLALVEHAQVDEGRTVASAPKTDERRRCSEIIEEKKIKGQEILQDF